MLTYLTKDVVDWVKANLPAAQQAQDWAIAGMGLGSSVALITDGRFKVQIIGFNPDTDFVITPWIASQFDGTPSLRVDGFPALFHDSWRFERHSFKSRSLYIFACPDFSPLSVFGKGKTGKKISVFVGYGSYFLFAFKFSLSDFELQQDCPRRRTYFRYGNGNCRGGGYLCI